VQHTTKHKTGTKLKMKRISCSSVTALQMTLINYITHNPYKLHVPDIGCLLKWYHWFQASNVSEVNKATTLLDSFIISCGLLFCVYCWEARVLNSKSIWQSTGCLLTWWLDFLHCIHFMNKGTACVCNFCTNGTCIQSLSCFIHRLLCDL